MHLPGIEPERPIGDALDRCYTPDRLADAVVAALPWLVGVGRIIEPSAGGGAFVRAVRKRHPDALIHGIDLDPEAPARDRCDWWTTCSWTDVDLRSWLPDLIIGNPPFGEALAHVEHALTYTSAVVALILPLAYLGVQEWAPLLDRRPPTILRPILGRPWPDRVRETAVYQWQPAGDQPCRVVPLRGYPR